MSDILNVMVSVDLSLSPSCAISQEQQREESIIVKNVVKVSDIEEETDDELSFEEEPDDSDLKEEESVFDGTASNDDTNHETECDTEHEAV